MYASVQFGSVWASIDCTNISRRARGTHKRFRLLRRNSPRRSGPRTNNLHTLRWVLMGALLRACVRACVRECVIRIYAKLSGWCLMRTTGLSANWCLVSEKSSEFMHAQGAPQHTTDNTHTHTHTCGASAESSTLSRRIKNVSCAPANTFTRVCCR